MRRTQVVISTLPEPCSEIFTNTKIRVFCQRSTSQPVSFVAEWRRQNQELEQIIHNHDNSSYECSPLDLDCCIEVKLKYEDGGIQTTTRRFGPVRLQPELQATDRPHTAQHFHAKTLIDNTSLQLGILLTKEQLVLNSHGLDFTIKLESLPYPQLRLQNYIVCFRLKTLSESFTKFVTNVLNKQLRYRQEVLDLVLESPARRNYFLYRLVKNLKRKGAGQLGGGQLGYGRRGVVGAAFGLGANTPKDTSRARKASNNSSLSVSKNRTHQEKPNHRIERSNTQQQHHHHNDILKDIQSKQLFTDLDPAPQAALNLRDSFVELQQKQQMKASMIDQSNRHLKLQLQQARTTIRNLNQQLSKLKKQNAALKLSEINSNQSTTSSGVEVSKLQLKVDSLIAENKRLESERTQIIADKIAAEVKYNKERQEKERIRRELEIVVARGVEGNKHEVLRITADSGGRLEGSRHDRHETHQHQSNTSNSNSRNNLSQEEIMFINQSKSFKEKRQGDTPTHSSNKRISPLRGNKTMVQPSPSSPLSTNKIKIISSTTPRIVHRQ